MKKDIFKIKHIVLVIVIATGLFYFGVYVGLAKQTEVEKVTDVTGKEPTISEKIDFSSFWKVWNTLNEKHPDSKNTNTQKKVYSAISGLVNSLEDPYTTFFDPNETKIFEEDISGNFIGVGMEVGIKDKILTVIAPMKNTPAFNAGIESGDKIIKIDEISTVGMSVDEAVKLIRGEKGTKVKLSIMREGFEEVKEITIIRDVINVPIIETQLRKSDRIFVVTLHSFSANSTKLFREALQEFSESKTDKLILDLRGNPGGYMDAAIDMASCFLPSGKTVVIEDYGVEDKEKVYRSYGYNAFSERLKFVILIDNGSASASEILAGAMQDYGKAILVGEKSFGKGSVQEVVKITPDTLLKITVAKWLTPNRNSISNIGLTPDYEVKRTEQDILIKRDPQIEKAAYILNHWGEINIEKK
ncbi:MAG: S41 family peptidase [Candidatus Paceibacterota bacterium]|jgi:carboxyl-terminal processing protease